MKKRASAAAAIALALHAAPAAAVQLVALTEDNHLLRFSDAQPGAVTRVAVSGVSGTLLGIDVRPADGRLYGVTTTNDLYTIDPASGAAQIVSTLTVPFDGSPYSGFDFNPQADRLRLVAESGQNLRVHVALGAVAVDGPLAYAPGDANAGARPRIAAAAYTDNVANAAQTRLFDVDARLDVLAFQDPPNDGTLRTVGALGVDFEPRVGFDIATGADGSELGLAASAGTLYRIDLATGRAEALGAIGDGRPALIGLAVVPAQAGDPVASHPGTLPARMDTTARSRVD